MKELRKNATRYCDSPNPVVERRGKFEKCDWVTLWCVVFTIKRSLFNDVNILCLEKYMKLLRRQRCIDCITKAPDNMQCVVRRLVL